LRGFCGITGVSSFGVRVVHFAPFGNSFALLKSPELFISVAFIEAITEGDFFLDVVSSSLISPSSCPSSSVCGKQREEIGTRVV
jgi:hypothetical protein